MRLSNRAIQELRDLLSDELSLEVSAALSDEEVSLLGEFYLEVFCQALKHRQIAD